uniref:PH domain-containing protein n=1 Tax=Strix occidentalis caurina TaxID=311401 RepID=A0A8D0F7K2_STROC
MASIMEGPLSKWTNVMKGWQYRWFVLDYNAGLLSYYTSKDKMMRGSRRGCVRLRGAVIGIDDEDDSTFTITVDQKTFHFQGELKEEIVFSYNRFHLYLMDDFKCLATEQHE